MLQLAAADVLYVPAERPWVVRSIDDIVKTFTQIKKTFITNTF